MPKTVTPLTATQVKNARPKEKLYKLSDGGGLSLWVYPSGNKNWVVSLQKNGKRQDIRKPFAALSLAEARLWREELRGRLVAGKAMSEGGDTFREVFDAWHVRWQRDVTPRYAEQMRRAIEINIMPDLADKLVIDIRPSDIVQSLRAMEERGALEYLRRTKSGIKLALDYAVAVGLIDINPAIAVTPRAFSKHKPKNFRALPPDAAPLLVGAVERGFRERAIYPLTYYLIYWQLLTLTRPGEAVQTQWSQIDFDAMIWTIPMDKTKKRREFIVPLTAEMLNLLKALKKLKLSDYVFPGEKQEHAHRETVLKALIRLKVDSTAHGFRALARSYLGETGLFDSELLEMCLSHRVGGKTRQAYDRAQYVDARRKVMDYWSAYIGRLRKEATIF